MNSSSIFNYFEFGAKVLLYLAIALVPIWFIPLQIEPDIGREITLSILIVLAALLWLLSLFSRGEIRYTHSAILWGAGLLMVVWAVSAVFSRVPIKASFFGDVSAEKFSTLALGMLAMVLLGAAMRSRREWKLAFLVLMASGGAGALMTAFQFISGISIGGLVGIPGAQGQDFNVVGTANGLSLMYSAFFMMGLGALFFSERKIWRIFFGSIAGLSLINIVLVNYRASWMIILGSGVFLLGFVVKYARERIDFREAISGEESGSSATQRRFGWRYSTTLVMLALALFMIVIGIAPFLFTPPIEVAPTFSTTVAIARSVFREGLFATLFGSGPGTFGLDWSLYKDPSINASPFWGMRFAQGFSWFSTILATIGVSGTVSFLIFIILAFFIPLKMLLVVRETPGITKGLMLGVIALALAAFLYPANFTLVLLLFILIGLLTSLLRAGPAANNFFSGKENNNAFVEGAGGEEKSMAFSSFFALRERTIRFEEPWALFMSSLFVIFFLFLGLGVIYFEATQARAAFARERGVASFREGNVDRALEQFENASAFEKGNFRTDLGFIEISISKMKTLLGRAARGEKVEQEFQTAVARAIQHASRATALNPRDPLVWRVQGAFYETLIPFVQGSERLANESYLKAAEFDPSNPALVVDRGRALLTLADRIQLGIGQVREEERASLDAARRGALEEARKSLEKAVSLKSDYAQAHFLLTQAALRLGNVEQAIKSGEITKTIAPFDIGVAFQLGVLYYQTNQVDKAQLEFERAVSLNANYSNARYFLGLIYDRKGDRTRASAEFELVRKSNPDNQEVARILENLRRDKPALEGIVPPGEPPEKRKEVPLEEGKEKGKSGRARP